MIVPVRRALHVKHTFLTFSSLVRSDVGGLWYMFLDVHNLVIGDYRFINYSGSSEKVNLLSIRSVFWVAVG